jgi:fatty-acyl-CoA synthase
MEIFERIKADYICLRGALRALKMTTPIGKNPTRIFPDAIHDLAEKYGDAPALLSERENFTYRTLSERANRYARWALRENIGKGETVCLLMPNRPEYMAIWIGVTHVGGVVALLNTNLVGPSLAHCIDLVEAKHIIVGAELLQAFSAIRPHLKTAPRVWLHGAAASDLPRIDSALDGLSGERLSAAERRPLTVEDRALYIYTSGTTGMPKAANVNHYRVMLASCGFAGVMDTQASDRMYDCLPMYHTTGGVVATGALLMKGGSVFIRERFSASQFWDDIVRHECTIVQYIGELCRYLVNSPPHPNETRHRLRLACGNGLRPDVWGEFKKRFGIPQITEFYAATEGNVQMFNFEGKPGAVGRIPWFLAHRFPIAVVRFDVEKEQPIRDARGFCIVCEPDEAGEAVGKILKDPEKPGGRFEGYARKEEDEKKILRNVFETGDAYFRTGDLMRKDKRGYFYFVDRVGDTFRWKGENVSTSEVAEATTRFPGIADANVYGVAVPGNEGRAGMAAIVCEQGCDLPALRAHFESCLPDYARPLFLRLRRSIEVTATFKQKKGDLVREGYSPDLTADPLFFNDPRAGAFVPIDRPLYERIQSGKIRM